MKIKALTRSWALFCALALITVSLQMSGTAAANHENRTLKLSPEKRNQRLESKHEVIATLSATPVDGPITIHFEIDGPGDPGTSGSGSGDEDSANMPDGNTPESPDRSCVVEVGATECQVFYRSSVEGTDYIRGWIDHDETVEADMGEGWDESLEPGDVPEKDNTDVVRTKWFVGLPRGANLTCVPDSPSQPQDRKNPVTCTLQKNGTGFAGWLIDAENLAGANDPDMNADFDGFADYDNICTTAEDGACTADIPAEPRKEAGTATVCFWVDLDDDAGYHRTPKRDGAQCDDPEPGPGENQGSHDTTAFAKVRWTSIKPSVTLTTSKTTTTSMERFRLSGSVESGTPGCEAGGASVEIYQRRLGSDVESVKTTLTTDADGNYGVGFRRRFSADYHAKLAAGEGCTAQSDAQRVNVKKKLTLEPNRKAVKKGRTVRLRAKVMSCTPDVSDKVVLTKLVKGAYKKRDVATTNDNCVAVFRERIKRRSVFRARSPQDADQLAGFSRRVAVRLK